MNRIASVALVSLGGALGCNGGAGAAAPPPLRPASPEDLAKKTSKDARHDCDPIDPSAEQPARTWQQRSVADGERLARQAVGKLTAAESSSLDASARQSLIGEAVNDFITALLADPYNVSATYNLAAAYARIDRKQCSLNLLSRLLEMRNHASRKDEVAAKFDRLLGRNRQPLDPDFNEMRGDARFRELLASVCDSSTDAGCPKTKK